MAQQLTFVFNNSRDCERVRALHLEPLIWLNRVTVIFWLLSFV